MNVLVVSEFDWSWLYLSLKPSNDYGLKIHFYDDVKNGDGILLVSFYFGYAGHSILITLWASFCCPMKNVWEKFKTENSFTDEEKDEMIFGTRVCNNETRTGNAFCVLRSFSTAK